MPTRKRLIEGGFSIIDKQNQKVPFIQNGIQNRLDEIREKLKTEGKPIWILILKARKEGVSAKVIADWTVDCLNPELGNLNAVVISHQQEATKRLFKRAKYYIETAKYEILKKTDNANEISFPETNSTFYIGTAGARAFGRGDDIHRCHLSEFAFYDEKFDIDGLLQAIPEGGEVIGETTANGIGNRFYKEWQRAKNGDSKFYPLFLSWSDNPDYRIKNPLIQHDEDLTEEELLLKQRYGLDYEQLAWRREKIKEFANVELFKQEYPICVSGNTLISFNGIRKIKDCNDAIHKGKKETIILKTKRGRELRLTADHKVFTKNKGYISARELIKGDELELLQPKFNEKIQIVEYRTLLLERRLVEITSDLARLIGYYMGDGSFYKNTVSLVFDAKDKDLIQDMEELMIRFLGNPAKRITGDKGGGVELRKSDVNFIQVFKPLKLVRQGKTDRTYRRKIHVPDYIKTSPRDVIKQFLRGIFEADGFTAYRYPRIVLFSKYAEFLKDIQLLLLGFGIESKINSVKKIAGDGHEYLGNELILLADSTRKFHKEIGFISERKQSRCNSFKKEIDGRTMKDVQSDYVESTIEGEIEDVYDLVTDKGYFGANGIRVHNCDREAFLHSGSPAFNLNALEAYVARNPTMGDLIEKDGRVEFVPNPKGWWRIWDQPRYATTYFAGCDTAEGEDPEEIGDADYTEIEILDANMTQVAELKRRINPDVTALELSKAGRYFNTAYVGVERNGGSGLATLNQFKNIYPDSHIYKTEVFDEISRKTTNKIGWLTNERTRPLLVTDLASSIADHSLTINSDNLLDECFSFIRNNQGKYEAQQGSHDDGVIAMGIAIQVRKSLPETKRLFEREFAKKKERKSGKRSYAARDDD